MIVPYETPTAAQFKARYPEFATLSDARCDALISDAEAWVDETWLEYDYQPAVMALAAHMLKSESISQSAAGGGVSGPIQSESLGDASITYADTTGTGWRFGDADFSTTPYGQRYLALRNRNHPAIITV